jgi:hypothetical protein
MDPVYSAPYQSLGQRLLRFDEAKWNDSLTRRGLNGIRSHPGYVATVVTRNIGQWFELTPHLNDDPERLDGRVIRLRHWTLPLFYPVTALGLIGLADGIRPGQTSRRGASFIVLTAAYFTVTSLVLVATPRLRAPFDLACCIGVGLLVNQVTNRVRRPGSTPGCG